MGLEPPNSRVQNSRKTSASGVKKAQISAPSVGWENALAPLKEQKFVRFSVLKLFKNSFLLTILPYVRNKFHNFLKSDKEIMVERLTIGSVRVEVGCLDLSGVTCVPTVFPWPGSVCVEEDGFDFAFKQIFVLDL